MGVSRAASFKVRLEKTHFSSYMQELISPKSYTDMELLDWITYNHLGISKMLLVLARWKGDAQWMTSQEKR